MSGLILSYLLIVLVLPVALSCIVGYRGLAVGRRCPRCRRHTLPLLDLRLRLFARICTTLPIERRWCLSCGWEGMLRLPPRPRAQPVLLSVLRSGLRPGGRPARPGSHAHGKAAPGAAAQRATQTLDIRSLELDGSPWRVMLQCWSRTGLVYGRLVFIGPSGRLWLDAVEAFSGTDQHEVLGQALSLPEPLLEKRLRRLVSS